MKKTQYSKLKLGVAPLVMSVALVSAPAFAQDTAAADEATGETSEIVVTGTLVRNPNLTTSSPVNVTSSDEIELRQVNVAEDILRDVPGVAANIGSSVNNGNGGASFVDLRGLGPSRNIVLLDSQRIAPANLNGNVDLNNIPLALIERVDVLTGGASTTYGADAVSGVVNFITKRDFAGVDLSSSYQITERGDGRIFRADLTVGANFDDGRGNAVLSIGYQKADPVYFGGERPRSDLTIDSFDGSGSGASGTASPSRFSIPGTGNLQIDPATGNLVPQFALFNFNPYNIFQTPFERYNMFSSARYEVSDSVEVFARGMFSQNTVETIIAPSGAFSDPLAVPLSNPYLPAGARNQFCNAFQAFDADPDTPGFQQGDYNPFAAGVQSLTPAECAAAATATDQNDPNYREVTTNVGRRLVEAGPRVSSYKTQLFDIMAGVRGSITDTLRYEVSGNYGESENTQTIQNYMSLSRAQQALRATSTTACVDPSGGCVPVNFFGPSGSITPDQRAFLLVPATSGNRTSLAQVRGLISGDLVALSDGAEPISFAAGVEYRKYTAEVFADQLAQDPGELGGAGGATTPVKGGYDVREVFGEIIAPLFAGLTLEAGVRYSDYKVDDVSKQKYSTWTYKAGATWEAFDGFKLRGNYQRAVRAPNIGEIFQPNAVGLVNLKRDPCQSDGTTIDATSNLGQVCVAQGALVNGAGNIAAFDPPSAGQINASFNYDAPLKPEKADTFTVGAIFQPSFVPNLTLSVDYYNIVINDAISFPTVGDILTDCFGNLTASSATSVACTSIRRDPAVGGLDGSAATVPGVPLALTNSGRLATDGIDVAANWKTDLSDEITLSLGITANYTFNSKFRSKPGGLNRECVGYYSINCTPTGSDLSGGSILPKFSFNQRTTLSFGDIDLSLLWRHISSTKQEPFDQNEDNFGTNGPAFAAFRKIKAFDWFDLTARANVSENFELTLSVMNLLDKDPPTVGSNIGSTTFNSGNTYPSTYDAIGRRYAVGARLKF
ncbi:TonB-dependent receptor domain-containing protein [Sphingopyxis sp.]|uniref:TonB-dependent receptor domain-containing protein n=1 Tax=Sphingopyxis sp. TaxID=1908224 RepID=UPI002ED8F904